MQAPLPSIQYERVEDTVELRTYWNIIWRRLWLIALIVGIVALYAAYQYYHLRKTPGALTEYSSAVTIQIGLQAIPKSDTNVANTVLVSEAQADAFVTSPILRSQEFDTQVSQQIGNDISEIEQRYGPNPNLGDWKNPGAIGGVLSASRTDSLVTITDTWITPAGAWAIANAVGEVTVANINSYLDYVVNVGTTPTPTNNIAQPPMAARVITGATIPAAVPGTSASKVQLLILLLLTALLAAIALAFLLDYLDDRIRSKEEVASLLQLPIYGEVPRAPALGRSRPPASTSRTPLT